MRRSNENTILARLRHEPDLSGSVIAKRTGLAPQTVSVLLRSFEAEGLIARGAVLRGKRGQPAVPFRLRGEAAYAIGVEVGWQQCNVVLLDFAGRITTGKRIIYPFPNPDRLVDDVVAGIKDMRTRVTPRGAPILGIGLTGPSDLAERAWVIGASKETCRRLAAIDLPAELSARTGLAVTTSNDGTSALWAEAAFGRVPTDTDSGYVFLSTFIGSALHVDGRVLMGHGTGAGRIGAAMTQTPDGKVGALHFTSSLWALAGFFAEKGFAVPAHDLAEWNWAEIEPAFAEWLDLAANAFALALANTAAIVGVPTLIVDGILPRAVLARLVNAIQTRINQLPIDIFDVPFVLIGQCGPSAPAIGAAYKLLHERYFAV
jgi:predicted NBD/HSP70 family sugar kinase